MRAIYKKASDENRSLTTEEQVNWSKADADFNALTQRIDENRRIEQIEARLLEDADSEKRAKKESGVEVPNHIRVNTLTHDEVKFENEYRDAFWAHARSGRITDAQRSVLEKRAVTDPMVVGTNAQGGYFVPSQWDREFIKTLAYYGGAIEAGNVRVSATGAPLNIPRLKYPGGGASAIQKGALITETTADAVVNMEIENLSMGAYTYTSYIIPVSWELLQDNEYNLAEEVRLVAAERIGRKANEHLTTGTGSGQPNGMVTASTAGVTAASASVIAAAELVDLEHSVNSAYRKLKNINNVGFMMADSTLAAIKKLSYGTTDDRPLWLPSIRDSEPDRILGYRYWINDDMAAIGTGLKSVLFGNFSKYWIRQVLGSELVVLREKYADQRMTGYFVYSRLDGELMDAGAIKHLVHP